MKKPRPLPMRCKSPLADTVLLVFSSFRRGTSRVLSALLGAVPVDVAGAPAGADYDISSDSTQLYCSSCFLWETRLSLLPLVKNNMVATPCLSHLVVQLGTARHLSAHPSNKLQATRKQHGRMVLGGLGDLATTQYLYCTYEPDMGFLSSRPKTTNNKCFGPPSTPREPCLGLTELLHHLGRVGEGVKLRGEACGSLVGTDLSLALAAHFAAQSASM